MEALKIKERVIEIFQEMRSTPNDYFDKTHFLDFLVTPTVKKNTLKNSFKGAKKYYNFIKKIELEYSICFSSSDQDKYYSLDRFVAKVQERLSMKKGNIMIIKARKKERERFLFEIILTFLMASIIYWKGIDIITIFLLIPYLLIMRWIIVNRLRDKKHTQLLYNKLMKDASD